MVSKPTLLSAVLAVAWLAGPASAHDGHGKAAPAATGPAAAYAFPLPETGSYRLPPLRRVAGGRVLTEEGKAVDLADLLRGRITVFSFIYTRCADICPAATMQLAQLRELARRHSELTDRLRLVSMSFDPEHDTPAVISEYGAQ